MSKREYYIAVTEGGHISTTTLKICEILQPAKNDFEYIYALGDIVDDVMDLQVGQSLAFKPNRDNKNSNAIILRFK